MPLQSRLEIEENLADGSCILKQGWMILSQRNVSHQYLLFIYVEKELQYITMQHCFCTKLHSKKQKLIIQLLALQKTELIIKTYLQQDPEFAGPAKNELC